MATTTNYGWTTPDDTALVKDGASAIRTLGSSVDTTTKNLNPETTLGDLAYRSSTANVKTRLGLGTAGQVLQVNSGANAPEWATLSSGGMTLISTTTLTGASVTLSSIPGTFNHLYLVIRNYCPATTAMPMLGRFNGDSGANRHARATSIVANPAAFGQTSFTAWGTTQTSTAANCNQVTVAFIPDYINTATQKLYYSFGWGLESDNTSLLQNSRLGLYNQTVAITSLEFFPQSGNFTSGTILLYGVK